MICSLILFYVTYFLEYTMILVWSCQIIRFIADLQSKLINVLCLPLKGAHVKEEKAYCFFIEQCQHWAMQTA